MLIRIYTVGLFVATAIALLLSILCFIGFGGQAKNVTQENKMKRTSKQYRLKTGGMFLLLAALSLVNALKLLLQYEWMTYLSFGIVIALVLLFALTKNKTIIPKEQ